MLRLLAALRRFHARLVPWLEVPVDRIGPWYFGIALFAIIVVGALVRARMVLHGMPADTLFNGNPMLTSTDGFYFAAGVGNTLTTGWGDPPRFADWHGHALVALAAGLVKLLGVQREAVFAWLPVVVGPLVALPLAFLGRALGRSLLGLTAGLFVVLAPAYFVRTVLGYFDTDMFALTVPLVAVLFLVRLFRMPSGPAPDLPPDMALRSARRDALLAALTLALYIWFYDQSSSIALAIALLATLGLVVLSLIRRADPTAPISPAVAEAPRHAFLFGLSGIAIFWPLRALAVILSHALLLRLKVRPLVLTLFAVVAFVASGLTSPAGREVLDKLTVYGEQEAPPVLRPGASVTAAKPDATWKPADTTGVVAEARVLPPVRMGEKLAGHWLLAIAGGIGFLGLLAWRPSLFVLLPITAVGLFGFIGGHRFLMYLAPAIGLGLAWVAAVLTRWLAPRPRFVASAALGVLAVIPAATGVSDNEISVAFSASEAEALLQLDARSKPKDTTIAWWDFGYPIQYFGKTRTICDGGRRRDDAAFAAEIIMTPSPQRAARLARVIADASEQVSYLSGGQVLVRDAELAGLGPEAFLAEVESGRWPPYKRRTGDIYLFLTKRLVPIVPVLEANRPQSVDAKRGALYQVVLQGLRSEGSMLYLQDGIVVDANKVKMRRPRPDGPGIQEKSLREVIVVGGSGPTFEKAVRQGDPKAPTSGILLRDLRVFIELDPRLLETQYAQLFFFENADPAFYEPVVLTPTTKIYRFKE